MADVVVTETQTTPTPTDTPDAVDGSEVDSSVVLSALERRRRTRQAERFLAADEGSQKEDRALSRLTGTEPESPAWMQAVEAQEGASRVKPAYTLEDKVLPAAFVERLPETATYAFQQRLGIPSKSKS